MNLKITSGNTNNLSNKKSKEIIDELIKLKNDYPEANFKEVFEKAKKMYGVE